jgi:ribosome-binding ATPase YchF (GTP1/OBG family)
VNTLLPFQAYSCLFYKEKNLKLAIKEAYAKYVADVKAGIPTKYNIITKIDGHDTDDENSEDECDGEKSKDKNVPMSQFTFRMKYIVDLYENESEEVKQQVEEYISERKSKKMDLMEVDAEGEEAVFEMEKQESATDFEITFSYLSLTHRVRIY